MTNVLLSRHLHYNFMGQVISKMTLHSHVIIYDIISHFHFRQQNLTLSNLHTKRICWLVICANFWLPLPEKYLLIKQIEVPEICTEESQ